MLRETSLDPTQEILRIGSPAHPLIRTDTISSHRRTAEEGSMTVTKNRPMPQGFLPRKGAAKRLGCRLVAVARMLDDGRLARYRAANGCHVMVCEEEVDTTLARNLQPVPVPPKISRR